MSGNDERDQSTNKCTITYYFQAFFIYSYKPNSQTLVSLLLSFLFSFHSSSTSPSLHLQEWQQKLINQRSASPVITMIHMYWGIRGTWHASDSFRHWSVIMQMQRDLDISMVLSTFFLKNIGLWITDYPTEERRMKIMIIYTIWNSVFATIVITRDLYFTVLYKGVSILLWCIEKRNEQLR